MSPLLRFTPVPPGSAGVAALALGFTALIASCSGGAPAPAGGSSAPTGSPPAPPPPPPPRTLFFGVQTHFGQAWVPALLPRLTGLGVTEVRDELYWQVVEPTAGTYSFPAFYDTYMGALRDAGINPLVELTFENTNYDGGQTPYTDDGIAAYTRYAGALLDRYGPEIKAVEVWNEYNGSFAKGPATSDRPATYTRMLRATYTAVKARRPDVTVVGGATSGVPLPYFDQLFTDGALDAMDAVSIHPYRYELPPEGIETGVSDLRNLMAKHGRTLPIWVTEIGWFLHTPTAPGDFSVDEDTQARYLVRAFALLIAAGVDHITWYDLRDDRSGPALGLVANDAALTPRRAYSALQTLQRTVGDAAFVARETAANGFYSIRFSSQSGRDLRIVWSLTPRDLTIPAGTTATDLAGAAVATGSGRLTVDDSPVYLSGPLAALPQDTAGLSALSNSESAFALTQGAAGWSYGYLVGASHAFTPLRRAQRTAWRDAWSGPFPHLSVTSVDQHPSRSGREVVAAVRRWTSPVAGTVRVHAHFRVGTKGDGVRVRIIADGQDLYADALNTRAGVARDFDFERAVRVGSTLDFAVDPGAAGDLNYDATAVAVAIERVQP